MQNGILKNRPQKKLAKTVISTVFANFSNANFPFRSKLHFATDPYFPFSSSCIGIPQYYPLNTLHKTQGSSFWPKFFCVHHSCQSNSHGKYSSGGHPHAPGNNEGISRAIQTVIYKEQIHRAINISCCESYEKSIKLKVTKQTISNV